MTDLYENIVIKDDEIDMEQLMNEIENKYSPEEIEKIKKDQLNDLPYIIPNFIDLKDTETILRFCKGEFL